MDLNGATPFMMLKIDDRYPDEWNGHGPVQYDEILVLFFFMIKIDNQYPDEWNEGTNECANKRREIISYMLYR